MIEATEIRNLIDNLNKATKAYDEGHPIMSDKEWDDLYFELKQKEEFGGIIYPDSPTQTIIYEKVDELNKRKHNHPMLSLDKTKDPQEIEKFLFKDSTDIKCHEWFAMFKLDGLTATLTYKNGILVSAETRGDGYEGENIRHNIDLIKNVPKNIPCKDEITIDGEIICKYEDFEPFKKEYKNPRNFAAGSIRLLDNKKSQARNLSFIAWDLVSGFDDIDFFFWRLEKLDDLGFETVPRVGDAETVNDAIDILDRIKEHKIYPIDGYVFKFESVKYGKSLGQTDHHFNNAIAFKFYDDEYESKLKDIVYDVSRNGILTPVAVFDPIEIDGSIVSRSNLYNMSIMKEILGETPYAGEKIWVIKCNQIIPQIIKAEKKDYGDIIAGCGVTVGLGGDYGILCPICGSLTNIKTSESGVDVLYCENEECPGKLTQKIDYFCSKKGLDIKGLSKKTIEKLIDWGWINGLKDIYKLFEHRTDWVAKEGFGEASVRKILNAIDTSKSNVSLESFISALGMPHIGRTVAKEITKYYNTWEDFKNAVGGDWTQFEGFGPEISKSLNNFDYTEADEIAKLLIFSDIQSKKISNQSSNIKDKTFCITGSLEYYSNRTELKTEIESLGGRVVNSMSSKVDYLLTNNPNSGSQKNKDALRLNVPIITEKEYIKMKS